MSCGFFWDGTTWLQPTEIHIWDGTAFVQAIEVHVYDGAVWIRIFPCEVVTLLEETALILDLGTVQKISRDTIKGPYVELILGTESVLVGKHFTITETGLILDIGSLIKISRDIIKGPFVELVLATEAGSIIITPTTPVIDFCIIENVVVDNKARVRFDPGDFCESVRVDKIIDSVHSFHQNINTTPNTTGILSNFYNGSCPEVVSFDVHPFNADGQSGIEGTVCSTDDVTLGTVGCK